MKQFNRLPLASAVGVALLQIALGAHAEETGASNTTPAEVVASDASSSAITLGTVVVFGSKQTRQVSEVSKSDLSQLTPGSSPLEAVKNLPGVNFNSPDSLGAYEWGSRISVRGFNQNQLGFTLDGIPLGDMSYRNYNGLHISRAIISEDLGRIRLAQGTGALDVASTSNLGAAVQFYSQDPSSKPGVKVQQSVGENNLSRTYARLDTGNIAGTNTRLSLSAVNQTTEKWKGEGKQEQQQVNAKLVSEFDRSRLSAFVNWSDRKEADYMDLSKTTAKNLGYNWDYYANWKQAIDSANHVWHKGETSEDDAYYNGSGLRQDTLAGLTYEFDLSESTQLKSTIYTHQQTGTGTWWLPNPPQVNGLPTTPVALRTLEFDINRNGVLSSITHKAGIHSLNAGIWLERNDFVNAMRFYSQDAGPSSLYKRPSNAYLTRWDYKFKTDTLQAYLQDTISATDNLTINIGVKSPHTTTSVDSKDDTVAAFKLNGKLKASKSVLPQLGVNYKLNDNNEFFASAAQNITAFRGVVKGGASPFDAKQAGFDAIKNTIKPEESTNIEAGWRYKDKALEASATVYHINFKNRLLAIQQGSAIAGNASVLSNVGSVITNGAEAFIAFSPIEHVKWSNSISYNDSTYGDDVTTNGVTYNTKDKQAVDSPKIIASSVLKYQNNALSADIGANYIGKRYYTYTNDQSVNGYALVNAGLGYKFNNVSKSVEDIELKFNITNLLNKKYYAFGDNPYDFKDPNGTSYNLLAGAPRSAVISIGAKF